MSRTEDVIGLARKAAAKRLTPNLSRAWDHLNDVFDEVVLTKEELVAWEQRYERAIKRLEAEARHILKEEQG